MNPNIISNEPTVTPGISGVTLNKQQAAVVEWARQGTGNCNVVARAGTGKTFLLVQLVAAITGRVIVLSFNKSIAEEIKGKLSPYPHAEGSTFHSIGYRFWRKLRRNPQLDTYKVRDLVKRQIPLEKKNWDFYVDVIGHAKQSGFGIPGYSDPKDLAVWEKLIMDDDDFMDEKPKDHSMRFATGLLSKVYIESLNMVKAANSVIDYNDMLLAPLVFGEDENWMRTYDWVFVDESQDLNECRRLMAARLLKTTGRFVAVGDEKQAIYGFSGANSDSMERIKNQFNSIELPLSTTYRCPQSVVRVAQQWVPDYEAAQGNPEGIVSTIDHPTFFRQEFDPERDVILCRNTRPLVGIAKRLRRAGIPCLVEGRTAKGLTSLAEKWGNKITIDEMVGELQTYYSTELEKLTAKNQLNKAEALSDKCEILLELAEDMHGDCLVHELVETIEFLFGVRKAGPDVLTLCTIHRAKGREWERVFLIGRNQYQPSYWAVKSGSKEALQQELNLMYVAVTRAKSELVEVKVPVKDRKKAERGVEKEKEWWEV